MSPTVWSFAAAIVAVAMEYCYRTLPGTWWTWAPLYIASGAVISYALHKIITQPGTPLIGALVLWSFAVIASRVFVTVFLLHDRVGPGTWCALCLMTAARIAQSVW